MQYKTKVVLVTIYYRDTEPKISLDDWESPDYLFLNDAIQSSLNKFNPASKIFDVAIDPVKEWIFHTDKWWMHWAYRLIRRKNVL
jgi:hypothetical protein